MKILCRLQNMAASEILNIVPQNVYQEIKQRDPNPMFRAYVVGHEGESGGKWVGIGNVMIQWFNKTIQKLVDKLQFGTKIFHNHGPTNEHEGRVPIGELVGKTLKQVKDKLSAIAVAYIYPEFRHIPLDVASLEADINLSAETETSAFEADVQEVTGIALGNSAISKPGFANATLLAELQAFYEERNFSKEDKWQFGFRISGQREHEIKLAKEGQ